VTPGGLSKGRGLDTEAGNLGSHPRDNMVVAAGIINRAWARKFVTPDLTPYRLEEIFVVAEVRSVRSVQNADLQSAACS
jgi:hypothetical protein